MDVEQLVQGLTEADWYRGQVVYRHVRPARPPVYAEDEPPRGPAAEAVTRALGIGRLYRHQAVALEAVREGRDILLHGGPAGGKSLAFLLPAVERALDEQRGSTLVLCPYKPVARAQLRAMEALARALPDLRDGVALYDGDLSASARRRRRGRPILITNPEMLHQAVLPNHPRWAQWFHELRMVVLEEAHAYSGLFGANVAGLLARLWRVCRHYGAHPQVVATTSTLSNPAEHARRLTGRDVEVLAASDGPLGAQTTVFWQPRESVPTVEAGRLVAELVARGHGTISFSRARVASELIAQYARERLSELGADPDAVIAYRGGCLPEELRAAEDRMHSGAPLGIATTNLLELGLDVPTLDAVVVCGWPGTRASFFQQAARAGRVGQPSLVIYVALNDPVNSFLFAHPDYVFDRPFEAGVVETANPHVLAGHLRCAVQELPLADGEADELGPNARAVLATLADRRKARQADGVWYNASSDRPWHELPLRGRFDLNVVIQDATTGRLVGEVDWLGAHSAVHPQAIYLHEGRRYLVREFNREERKAYVTPVEADYYTNPLDHTFVESVGECLGQRALPGGTVFHGEVTAGAITTGFEQRRFDTNELIRIIGLELPPVTYRTTGLWICLSAEREAELAALGLSAEYRGLGNALRIVLPLFMTCDVLDLGPWSGQTNFPWEALYFYERYASGLGFAERMFGIIEQVFEAAMRNLADCTCRNGCPNCVGDPVRPFIVNNPELEGDLIPPRAATRLLAACLTRPEPVEELAREALGRDEAARLIAGRLDLVARRREEARGAPPRVLPSDEPAQGAAPSRPLPLQLERSVRRRIERMREPVEPPLPGPVERAATPPPEPAPTLPVPDAAMRSGTPTRQAGRPTEDDLIAREAVRRLRERRKQGRQDER